MLPERPRRRYVHGAKAMPGEYASREEVVMSLTPSGPSMQRYLPLESGSCVQPKCWANLSFSPPKEANQVLRRKNTLNISGQQLG